MPSFEQLFGSPLDEIQPTCVLTPFVSNEMIEFLQLNNWNQGTPYASGQASKFTLIHTQMGAAFVGDAVLHLENSPCQNLIYVGTAGAISDQRFSVGSIALIESALNMESFSSLVSQTPSADQWGYAHQDLLNLFSTDKHQLIRTRSASFGSFFMEGKFKDFWQEHNIDILDKECCAFYEASKQSQKRAVGLLYVTDVLTEGSVFDPMTPGQQAALQATTQRLLRILEEGIADLR